ncbi:MAG: hypothetical protein HN548_07010 [Opitutae bacterium]|jgi:hypothetical protein|nr:hypothetical protein [Opitutae bacterium]
MDHNATQATAFGQPTIRSGQISEKPNLNLLIFDRNQSLTFPTLSFGRTFFWIISRGIHNPYYANFFSSEGQGYWGNNHSRRINLNGTNNIQNGIQRRDGENIVFNAVDSFLPSLQLISLRTIDFQPANVIGRAGTGDYFHGNFGEILVYDRALSNTEIETVEKYLGQKWGISISHDTTPSPTGNPSTFTVTPANDSVTTAHLSEQILKYLKPEITIQPQAQTVYADSNFSFSVTAEGKYLTYQWKKDGVDLTGENNATLNITDANATLHDGNYSVVVSNDFGSVESEVVEVLVFDTLMNGLVGWWKFDETNGTVTYDSSGNGNDGNLSGGPTWATGKIGGALSFDGVDDFMTVNQKIFYNKTFSISLWVKNSLNNTTILYNGSTHLLNQCLHLGFRESGTNGLYFAFYGNDLDSTFTGLLDWSVFTFTFDNVSKERASYANGNQISSDTSASSYIGSGNLILGKNSVTGSDYYIKILDDLRIYDRALSAAEVQALYNLGQ